jgi:hypothetical protein
MFFTDQELQYAELLVRDISDQYLRADGWSFQSNIEGASMSSIYEAFETDPDLEKQGIDIDYGDFKFKIARAGGANKKYQKRLEALTRPYRRAIQTETMDNAKADELIMQAFAQTVVLDWEGVTDKETGELIPFSSQACLKLFKALPDLFTDIREQATKWNMFKKDVQEEDSKNL